MRKVELLPTRDCEAGYGSVQDTFFSVQNSVFVLFCFLFFVFVFVFVFVFFVFLFLITHKTYSSLIWGVVPLNVSTESKNNTFLLTEVLKKSN